MSPRITPTGLARVVLRPWAWIPLFVGLALFAAWLLFPTDRTPKGAYYRVVVAVNRGQPEALFPYVETEAQHAAFTIGDYARKSKARVEQAYPEPDRSRELARINALTVPEPGPGIFAMYAAREGWVNRLRRDLSGVQSVQVDQDRATVETARGTRYPFRRRENGIWGLTLFTARLVEDSEKAARDFAQIDAAAHDYEVAASAK